MLMAEQKISGPYEFGTGSTASSMMIVRSGFDPSDITAERRTAARALCVAFKRPLQRRPTRSNVSLSLVDPSTNSIFRIQLEKIYIGFAFRRLTG